MLLKSVEFFSRSTIYLTSYELQINDLKSQIRHTIIFSKADDNRLNKIINKQLLSLINKKL